MKKLFLFFAILLYAIVFSCAGNNNTKNISGTLYVAGNEPFTFLALNSEDGNVYGIECSDSLKIDLWKLQGNIVAIEYNEIQEFENSYKIHVVGYTKTQAVEKE